MSKWDSWVFLIYDFWRVLLGTIFRDTRWFNSKTVSETLTYAVIKVIHSEGVCMVFGIFVKANSIFQVRTVSLKVASCLLCK